MKTTYKEILDKGYWDEYCEIAGLNPWAINEGLVSGSDEVELTDEVIGKLLGLLGGIALL